jgi:hypothetical protein
MTMHFGSPLGYFILIPLFLFVYQAIVAAEEAYDGDEWDESVAKDVSHHDHALVEPFRPGGPNVVLAKNVEQLGAKQAHEHRTGRQTAGERRDDEQAQAGDRVLPDSRVADNVEIPQVEAHNSKRAERGGEERRAASQDSDAPKPSSMRNAEWRNRS